MQPVPLPDLDTLEKLAVEKSGKVRLHNIRSHWLTKTCYRCGRELLRVGRRVSRLKKRGRFPGWAFRITTSAQSGSLPFDFHLPVQTKTKWMCEECGENAQR